MPDRFTLRGWIRPRRAYVLLGLGWLWVSHAPGLLFGAPQQSIRTHQPGRYLVGQGDVRYRAGSMVEAPARTNQTLDFGDTLRTLQLSRATIRFSDRAKFYMRDLTDLQIVAKGRNATGSNDYSLYLTNGAVYVTSHGGPVTIPIQTEHATGTATGTEFLVTVNRQLDRTEVAMFNGQVELRNEFGVATVRPGQQGVAEPGQIPRLAPIEAAALVQWWIYYPGVIDPDELALSPAERAQFADSLEAYRSGNLAAAVRQLPAGVEPATDNSRIYLAAVLLAAGAVEGARSHLNALTDTNAPPALALRTMMNAVAPPVREFLHPDRREPADSEARGGSLEPSESNSRVGTAAAVLSQPESASLLLAVSYAHQAINNLTAALQTARAAVARSTNFSFGWARVAELEFSHGRTRRAHDAVAKALASAPFNAQAIALQGFLLAESHPRKAIDAFNRAIEIDPGLANAWLGRGLCQRRLSWQNPFRRFTPLKPGDPEPAWLSDLQTAAILEPRRSLLRSYSGKAFGDVGHWRLAEKELGYAKQLDPHDPTPWLYSALLKREQNRINEAVSDLEESVRRNDNRAVYRSRFLLDEDRAVRSSSLANLYQSAGLNEVSLAEAARAVSYDYANHSAHQFLAESYDALRDPTRFNLRYETVWFNELLLANLLSPVGATPLSQHISQQEYARLFDANRVGLVTDTSYRSDGQYRAVASQYGVVGNTAWSLDLDYQHNNGVRPNNELDRTEWATQFKQQVGDRDAAYLRFEYLDLTSGDNYQHFHPADVSTNLTIAEKQAPLVFAGWHREWQPGIHTVLLGGRLSSEQTVAGPFSVDEIRTNSAGSVTSIPRTRTFGTSSYESHFDGYSAELNQIFTSDRHRLVAGARFNDATIQSRCTLDSILASDGTWDTNLNSLYDTPNVTAITAPVTSAAGYVYESFTVFPRWTDLRITGGLSYDFIRYPGNFRFPPLIKSISRREQLSPKAALRWEIIPDVTCRGMYARSLGGVSMDGSVRLEPSQLEGFNQVYRAVISESEVGSVAVPQYELGGLALDLKLRPQTFLNLQAELIQSDVQQEIGVYFKPPPNEVVAAQIREVLGYREFSTTATLHQQISPQWSARLGYRLTDSSLRWSYPTIGHGTPQSLSRTESAFLHSIQARCLWNGKWGLFGHLETLEFIQSNDGYGPQNPADPRPRPGEACYQLNLTAGWRFARQRGQISMACLNITDQGYRLNSLTPYAEMPRTRVWLCQIAFVF